MKCQQCGTELLAGAANCPACGAPAPAAAPIPPPPMQQQMYPGAAAPAAQTTVVNINAMPNAMAPAKSRNVFALLGFFFGNLGIHEFYRGKIGNGVACILGNFLLGPFLIQLFNGIELLAVSKDSEGRPMSGSAALAVILGLLMILGNIGLFILVLMMFLGGGVAAMSNY